MAYTKDVVERAREVGWGDKPSDIHGSGVGVCAIYILSR